MINNMIENENRGDWTQSAAVAVGAPKICPMTGGYPNTMKKERPGSKEIIDGILRYLLLKSNSDFANNHDMNIGESRATNRTRSMFVTVWMPLSNKCNI